MEQHNTRFEDQAKEAGTTIKDRLHEGLAYAEKTAIRAGEAVKKL